jgi:hypothetical protein
MSARARARAIAVPVTLSQPPSGEINLLLPRREEVTSESPSVALNAESRVDESESV